MTTSSTEGLCVRIEVRDVAVLAVARRQVRAMGAAAGLPQPSVEALATAVTEVARNIVVHAGSGELMVRIVSEPDRLGVVVVARDDGPGISDIPRAMADGYTTGGGLGLGLPSAERFVDEFQVTSVPGMGTTVILKKWAPRGDTV